MEESNRRIFVGNKEFPGKPITPEEQQKRLYHYTTLESFLKIWATKTLLFSDATNMNDILESHKSLSVQTLSQEVQHNYHEVVHSYKQISLTMDYDSYIAGCMSRMMWGHYGQKGEGVCIELDPQKINLDNTLSKPINYNNHALSLPILPPRLTSKEDIEKFVLANQDSFFFTKTLDWTGENEYRIISNSMKTLDISNAITNVYVTSAYSITCKCVEELVTEDIVKFFHHNVVDSIMVPMLTSTREYRKSLEMSHSDKNRLLLNTNNDCLTLQIKSHDGSIKEEVHFGNVIIQKI